MNDNNGQNSIKQRYANLDVIKGVCILMVVFTHYDWSDRQRLILLFPFWIAMAVPVFMVITGYVSALSYNRTGSFDLKSAYKPTIIISKCLRYTIPFIPAFIIGALAQVIGKHKGFSIIGLVLDFIKGGYGPGSYYFPIMIQLMFILPIVYYFIDKYETKGLIVCFVFTILFELACKIINISDGFYRFLAFRYIFIASFGCYLYGTKCQRNKAYWVACLLGIVYIILFEYIGIRHIFINDAWDGTSVFAVLFILPIVRFAIGKKDMTNKVLELLGKASYNIFLVQMVYYLAASEMYKYVAFVPLRIIINMVVCCLVGVVFYKIENPITNKIIKKIRG